MRKTAFSKPCALAILLALLISPAPSLHAQLSADAQRDLLLLQMAEAAMAVQHADFLELLARYEAGGGLVEPEMRYYEALALAELADEGELIRARDIVADFINTAGAAHPLYRQALELYSRVQPEAEALENALRAEAAARAEAERLQATRMENLPSAPLYTALAEGQRLLRIDRFTSPSPWEDGSSPQDFMIRTNQALHRSEVHQGLLPRPDGGWIAFGQRPLPGAAPEAERPRNREAILNGTHAPQSTFYPQSSILRFDADGNLQSSHHIDWRQVYVTMINANMPVQRSMGIRIRSASNGLLVTDISPIRSGLPTQIQAGDIITHIERRAVNNFMVDAHLDDFRRNRNPRFRILRNGERLDLEVPFAPGFHPPETRPGGSTSWPIRVVGYAMNISGMETGQLPAPDFFLDWSSDIVALVPGAGDSFTLCANIDVGHVHGGLMQTGVLLRGRFDDTAPGGVLLDDHAIIVHDSLRTRNNWTWWFDSGLLDCTGLPDGGLLTVSRATRLIASTGHREPNRDDFFDRYIRVYDANGRLSNLSDLYDEKPAFNPRQQLPAQPYYALQPQLRLQAVTTGPSWHWQWRNWHIQVEAHPENRPGFAATHMLHVQGADNRFPALLSVYSPAATELDAWHELELYGSYSLRLLPRYAAEHVQMKRVAQRADGSYVALLGVTHSELALGQSVPGGILGDINGPKIRDNFVNFSDGWLQEMAYLGGQEDFLVGLSENGELLWSLRLQPEDPVEASFDPEANGWDEERSRVAMQEWTNLAVLTDDSILVTMKSGHGLRISNP